MYLAIFALFDSKFAEFVKKNGNALQSQLHNCQLRYKVYFLTLYREEGRGHWAVHYTSFQSFTKIFYYSLA